MYPNYGNNRNNLTPNSYSTNQNYTPLTPQGGQYSSQDQNGFLAPNNSRGVYTSMISPQSGPSSASKFSGLGGLSSMGRVVKEDPDPVIRVNEPPSYTPNPAPSQGAGMLSFRNTNDKPKMAASMIFPKAEESPQGLSQQGFGTSRLESMLGRGKVVEVVEETAESVREKRQREIGSIKEEFDKLNKRMENYTFSKPGENKQYFQLPSRRASQQQPPAQEQTGEGHFGVFRNYSSGNAATNNSQPTNTTTTFNTNYSPNNNYSTNTNYSTSTNYSGNNNYSANSNYSANNNYSANSNYSGSSYSSSNNSLSPQSPPTQFLHQNSDPNKNNYLSVQSPQTSLQHSLSANDIRQGAKREEPVTMFKKKTANFEGNSQNPPAKTFILSPRAQPGLPPKPTSFGSAEYKPAETVVQSPAKNVIKRIDSVVQQIEIAQPQPKKGPIIKEQEIVREFRKSDFAIGKKMGKGQFGEVNLVVHKATGFLCGMKVMSKKQIKEQKYENQIARELSIQFYLNHRNVSPLYGYFTDEENIYLLVQFATGGQLLQMLRKAHRMQEQDCSPIIREICEGLKYIHSEEIIHRDIKPENILFNFDTVKICDFGWAVHSGQGMRRTIAGSPLYYSPEVVQETQYDEKIDIWAIGMMTYECLLGKIPFRIYSQLDLNRIVEDDIKFPEYVDVTDEAKDFILKICKKVPEERMEMRGIMNHPFIKKYLDSKKVSKDIIEEFGKFLSR